MCECTFVWHKIKLEGVTWIGDMDVNINAPDVTSLIVSSPEKYNLVRAALQLYI